MIPFPNEKYEVIYADPPWNYNQKGSEKDKRGMAEKHYQTMKVEDICKLPIRDIATDNAILFMWATFPTMPDALKVIDSWGFTYKTAAFVWVKKNKKSWTNFWGMGAYTRANAEVCLVAISKKTKAKEMIVNHGINQIVEERIERHSKKPDAIRNLIVDLVGDRKRIELFARNKSNGWDVWGNEV